MLPAQVSALMPTRVGRRKFISGAVTSFLAQDYPNKELIVLGDDDETIVDLLPIDSRIRYLREPKKNHGEKINRCVELAVGDLLVVWDDDDQYPTDRLTRIVAAFENPSIEVAGSSSLFYQDGQNAYLFTSSYGWLSAIAFRRSAWERHGFEPLIFGADWLFQQTIKQENPAALLDFRDPSLVTALIHPDNTSKKVITSEYRPISWTDLPKY